MKSDLTEYRLNQYGHRVTFDENGKLHSHGDRPSLISTSGAKFWHKHNELHRETGPAIIDQNGFKSYVLNGEKLAEEVWKKKVAALNK